MFAGLLVQANPMHIIHLKNGLTVGVEACQDGIFRIKVTPRSQFGESLMERYGILKTDWKEVKQKMTEDNTLWSLSTGKYEITIDEMTGKMSVKNAAGNEIISDLTFLTSENPLCGTLAKIINEKYAGLHVQSNGGIIGDDDGTFSEKDKAESGDPAKSSIISIRLEKGERFYGGGSTSREHIQHRGEMLRMWVTYQHTEIPMPFVMSSEGWGIFNNTTRKNFFDIGSHDPDVFNIYNTCDEADFYMMFGNSMPDVLNEYTRITGRTYVLPKWAYGLCFGPNMMENQFNILNDAVLFRQTKVPCDVLWLEPQWMEKRYDFSTKKKWNYKSFSPEPYWMADKYPKKLYDNLFIGRLRNMGFHLGLWLCEEYDPSITEEDAIAARKGLPQSGREHWMDHLTDFLDMGVEGFKLDPARTIDEHTFFKYYNGCTDKEMHNLNQVLLPKQMEEMERKHTGKRTWHHYTAGWSGTQHWGASTSGDNGGGMTALFDQLNLGMSGYMNTSCDVMSVEKDQRMQSLHFGTFLPWLQINSWFSMMQPFYFNEKEQNIYRDYMKLRYSLIPYIYSAALEGAMTGMPIVRAMPLMFPDDRNVDDMVHQYMFGQNFCVGIFSNEIYLPEGVWTDAWTGERITSRGEKISREYPDNRAGLLYIREGAIIPCQPDVQYIGTTPADTIILKIYPHGDSGYTMYEDDGESYAYETGAIAATRFECRQNGKIVEFTINPVQGTYKGMPSKRTYELEVCSGKRPSRIFLGNKRIKDWTFGKDNKTRLILGNIDKNDLTRVTIKY
jgi:alpha-glucosidase (family GH31 glycosyl hydrolase)